MPSYDYYIMNMLSIEINLYLNAGWYQKASEAFKQLKKKSIASLVSLDIHKLQTMIEYLQKSTKLSDGFHFIQLVTKSMDFDNSVSESEIVTKCINDLHELAINSKKEYKQKIIPILTEKLRGIGNVTLEEENLVVVNIQVDLDRLDEKLPHMIELSDFLEFCVEGRAITLKENFILSFNVLKFVNILVELINGLISSAALVENSFENISLPDITEQLNNLCIQAEPQSYCDITKKDKKKTRKDPQFTKNTIEETKNCIQQEENYGFRQIPERSPAIPIDFHNAIPDDTLFISMPLNNPQFTPFLKLTFNKDTQQFFPIGSIASSGCNQQGAKLSSILISGEKNKTKRVPLVRLKTLSSTERAIGFVEEINVSADGRKRQMFVISKVVDKKDEQRNNYKL